MCKKTLLEAYEGTEVFGFEFPYELPEYRGDENYENPEELECAGLERTERRGIIAREFTLKLPDGGKYSDKNDHLPGLISRKRRAMARLIITRCFKSYDDINACDSGSTPLTAAVDYGEEELFRLLCERADVLVNIQDGHKCTALYWAFEKGHVGCMRILLDVGRVDVDTVCRGSLTALHGAAYDGHLEVAALLIERGANINAANDYGRIPLDSAHQTYRNSAKMVALLKSKDAKRASELAATTSTTAAAP